jgi:hypothetical protein
VHSVFKLTTVQLDMSQLVSEREPLTEAASPYALSRHHECYETLTSES